MSLYWLEIAKISNFSSSPPIAYLKTHFLRISKIQSWYLEGILAFVFASQAYASKYNN